MARTGPQTALNSARVDQRADRQNTVVTVTRKVRVPAALKGWHEIARGWYLALKYDGQAQLYEQSDWHIARHIAQLMSEYYEAPREERTAAERNHILNLLDKIHANPDARQRARIEVLHLLNQEQPAAGEATAKPSRIEEIRRRKTRS